MTPAQLAASEHLRDELMQMMGGVRVSGEYKHPFAVVSALIPTGIHPDGYVTFVALIRPDGSRL